MHNLSYNFDFSIYFLLFFNIIISISSYFILLRLFGQINYQDTNLVMVKAEDLNSELIYYSAVDSNQDFSFINIKPGLYKFSAYEILGDYDYTIYFSGSWNPFKRASKFQYYDQTLEVRNHFDIKDMVIEIK